MTAFSAGAEDAAGDLGVRPVSGMRSPIAFPHYLGPGTRGLSSVLLYSGALVLCVPTWVTTFPVRMFNKVGSRSDALGHPLTGLFGAVSRDFRLAQDQAVRESEALKPLLPCVRPVVALHAGDSVAFSRWEAVHAQCLPVARGMLTKPLHRLTASVDFVWRVWEAACEIYPKAEPRTLEDVDAMDPDPVLAHLQHRAVRLGSPELLLAECLLNRYSMPQAGTGHYATADEFCTGMLAMLGLVFQEEAESAGGEIDHARCESLAFYLYDQVLRQFVPSLDPRGVPQVVALMERVDERTRMKENCAREATALLGEGLSEATMAPYLKETLERMSDEARAVVDIDKSTMRSYLSTLAEDPAVWTTVAGLIGLRAGLPDVVAASLAVTAFSLVGATGVKASRERSEVLRSSPWSLLYFARR